MKLQAVTYKICNHSSTSILKR